MILLLFFILLAQVNLFFALDSNPKKYTPKAYIKRLEKKQEKAYKDVKEKLKIPDKDWEDLQCKIAVAKKTLDELYTKPSKQAVWDSTMLKRMEYVTKEKLALVGINPDAVSIGRTKNKYVSGCAENPMIVFVKEGLSYRAIVKTTPKIEFNIDYSDIYLFRNRVIEHEIGHLKEHHGVEENIINNYFVRHISISHALYSFKGAIYLYKDLLGNRDFWKNPLCRDSYERAARKKGEQIFKQVYRNEELIAETYFSLRNFKIAMTNWQFYDDQNIKKKDNPCRKLSEEEKYHEDAIELSELGKYHIFTKIKTMWEQERYETYEKNARQLGRVLQPPPYRNENYFTIIRYDRERTVQR